jgi:two-component system, chemotaxis family, protein-glutamate methylesterase/glutaminase
LIVEDSLTAQQLLTQILNSDPEIAVIGTALDGDEALKFLNKAKPDVITMDFHLPGDNGLKVARQIMETKPVPIIIVSATWTDDQFSCAFELMDAGAVGTVRRPAGPGHPDYEATSSALRQLVKSMSEIKVVKRSARFKPKSGDSALIPQLGQKVVAIGASTGGPPVLATILSSLGDSYPYPILIVQHIGGVFLDGLVSWLRTKCSLPIEVGKAGTVLQGGHVYIAPDGLHMGVTGGDQIFLSDDDACHGVKPSADFLFRSVAQSYGPRAIGILLTGMGADGAEGLSIMHKKGAVTIAQEKLSCAVFGMPAEAIRLEAAQFVLVPEKIGQSLIAHATKNK